MPRGSIAKRSAKPGAPGPPGPSGLGVLAFPDIATMAAFPTAAYVDGVDSHVLSLDEMWSYDPTSTLAPDVTAYAPLGITIVSANGPGNWTRRNAVSLRWRDQPAWFVDPVAGDDEADGATAPTALGTFGEFLRRVQGLPMALVAYDVTIMSDLTEAVVIDTRHTSGVESLYIHAAPIVLFASTITSNVVYNDATQTVGTITVAGIPVSWTASGLVGRLVRIPSTGVQFWIMEDMGAKTARISPPQAGIFDATVGVVTNVAFEVYDLVQFGSSVSVISAGGEAEQVDFETLELGTTSGAHVVEVKSGSALFDSCRVNGLDLTDCEPTFYNCSFYEFRSEQGTKTVLANGYSAPGGGSVQTRQGALVQFTRFMSYTAYLIRQGSVLSNAGDGFAGFIDAGVVSSAFQVEPQGLIDTIRGAGAAARIWSVGQGAGDVGAFVLASGQVVYDQSKLPIFTGAAIEVQLGNTTKTVAQLPYTNPIDQASFVGISVLDGTEDYFLAKTVDSTLAVTGAYVAILSQAITVNGLRDTLIDACWSVQTAAASVASIRITIDGVQVTAGGIAGAGILAGAYWAGSLRWRAALAAGAHTIELQIQTIAGTIFVRPATEPNFESASLTIRELYG